MLDKNRILSKLDELDSYLMELEEVAPNNFAEYVGSIEKKRACERLLHILIECVIDICSLIVKGLRLGLPSGEEDLFEKLEKRKIITKEMKEKLKTIRGFRNILVHRYGEVDDELVFDGLNNIDDFRQFREKVISVLKKNKQ